MKRSFNPAQVPQSIALESVQVASPCHADWNAMHGDDQSRFCPSCAKNVYNLSSMTREEAELLLLEKEGRLCVRYFLREDGTMLTQDCPVGVAALKQRSPSFALWAGVASLLVLVGALMSPSFITGAHAQPDPKGTETVAPAPTSTPQAAEEVGPPPVMGDFAYSPRPTVVPTPDEGLFTLGEVRAVPSAAKSSTPAATAQPAPVMGKPMISPTSPPRPKAQKLAVLGQISHQVATAPSPTPTTKPTPAPVPRPVMGLVMPSTPPTKTPKKAPSTSKKTKSSRSK